MRKFNVSYILYKNLEIKNLEILQIKIIAFYLFNYKNVVKNILTNFYLKNYNYNLKISNFIY